MMIELTHEQRQSISNGEETPPRVVDPSTQTRYVLVREDVYDRIRFALESDDDPSYVQATAAQAMTVFGRDGWDDPAMDIYNDLDPRKNP